MSIGEHDERPWGNYTVLDEGDGYKVKRIVVNPGQRLTLQRHGRRAEHWVPVSGAGVAVINGAEIELVVGHAVDVPVGAIHRAIAGPDAPLVFVEVQRGGYLGEDDIERLDDDYGRAG